MPKHFVDKLKTGETYTTDFAVTKKQTRTTKNNKRYLILELSDKTGAITSRMWEEIPNELVWTDIKVGGIYEAEGKVEEYQGNRQFIITHIKAVEDYVRSDFMPVIEEDPEILLKDLREIHSSITDQWIKKLLDSFFDDELFINRFKEAPAAKSIHDSALGGLLRHTYRMTKLSLEVLKNYPEMTIDRDLVIAGIAFHDMEKINEYNFNGATVEYSDTGRFVGHTVMACNSIYAKIREIDGFPKELEDHVIHIVASHAGEYDPIRLPSTLEANVVHLVDFLDSRLVHFQQEKDKAEEDQRWKKDYYSGNWMFFGDKEEESGDKLF